MLLGKVSNFIGIIINLGVFLLLLDIILNLMYVIKFLKVEI